MSRLADEIAAMLAIDDAGRLRPPLPGNVRRILSEALTDLTAPAIDASGAAAQLVIVRAIAWSRSHARGGMIAQDNAAGQLREAVEAMFGLPARQDPAP